MPVPQFEDSAGSPEGNPLQLVPSVAAFRDGNELSVSDPFGIAKGAARPGIDFPGMKQKNVASGENQRGCARCRRPGPHFFDGLAPITLVAARCCNRHQIRSAQWFGRITSPVTGRDARAGRSSMSQGASTRCRSAYGYDSPPSSAASTPRRTRAHTEFSVVGSEQRRRDSSTATESRSEFYGATRGRGRPS